MLDTVVAFNRIFAVLFISIMVHELGHLVTGKILGDTFQSFAVYPFHIYKAGNKLRFKLEKKIFSGHCFLTPIQAFEKFNPFWRDFGGIFFNLLLACISFILLEYEILSDIWTSLLRPLMIMNFVFGLGNLVPMKFFQYTDGYNIIKALLSDEYKRGLYVVLTLDKELKNGKRFRDLESDLLLVNSSKTLNNFFVSFLVMTYGYYLSDRGNHEVAMEEFSRLDLKQLFYEMRCEVKCEMLFYYLIYSFDEIKCKELYEDQELNKFLQQNKATPKRVLATYTSIILGNKHKGETLINEAIYLAYRLEGGYKTMELDRIRDFMARAVNS